jgi:hypothetical protein
MVREFQDTGGIQVLAQHQVPALQEPELPEVMGIAIAAAAIREGVKERAETPKPPRG